MQRGHRGAATGKGCTQKHQDHKEGDNRERYLLQGREASSLSRGGANQLTKTLFLRSGLFWAETRETNNGPGISKKRGGPAAGFCKKCNKKFWGFTTAPCGAGEAGDGGGSRAAYSVSLGVGTQADGARDRTRRDGARGLAELVAAGRSSQCRRWCVAVEAQEWGGAAGRAHGNGLGVGAGRGR